MKIAILLGRLEGGGAEVTAARWAQSLARSGHDVHILLYGATNWTVSDGIDVRATDIGRGPTSWLRGVMWLRRSIRAVDPDLVLSLLTLSNLLLLVGITGARRRPVTVISERNTSPILRVSRAGRAKDLLARIIYRRADGGVAVSHAVGAQMVGRYGMAAERVFVVPNPSYSLPPVSRDDALRADGTQIAFVGRLAPEKQVDRLIEALAALRMTRDDVSLVVVGDGPLRASLEDLAAKLGVPSTFVGWKADWRACVPTASCLVVPSMAEGFPNVAIEATSAGIPVVVNSQALGVSDGVIPGVTGVFAASTDSDHLAEAILLAIEIEPGAHDLAAWEAWFSPAASSARLLLVLEAIKEKVR